MKTRKFQCTNCNRTLRVPVSKHIFCPYCGKWHDVKLPYFDKKRKRALIIFTIIFAFCAFLVYRGLTAETRVFNVAKEKNSKYLYKNFLKTYPDSKHKPDIYICLYKLAEGNVSELLGFVNDYYSVNDSLVNLAFYKANTILSTHAEEQNDIDGWQKYIEVYESYYYPTIYQRQVQDYIDTAKVRIVDLIFQDDEMAWKFVDSERTTEYCKRYLSTFPKGKYRKQCNKLLIDIEVDEILASGNYGNLPATQQSKVSSGISGHSIYEAENDTKYTLTIRFSGKKESKILVISPHKTKSVKLVHDTYDIVASVDAYNVTNYYGREELDNFIYSTRFFISSTSYSSHLRNPLTKPIIPKNLYFKNTN
jgi:DNA-directed RNA polymerase subunit RPC12/RpoP